MLYIARVMEMTIEVVFGEISETIREAIELAGYYDERGEWASVKGALIKFKFNGVMVAVRADSDPKLIYRDWRRAMKGYIDNDNVGPYPNPALTDEEKESDARIEAEKKRY